MGKGKAPSPDPNIGIAALKEAKLGEDYLAFAREQYAAENKRNDELAALTKEVSADQLQASKTAQQWAAEDRSRYKSVFQPVQDELIRTAKTWDSAERQSEVAAEARADVERNAAAAEASRARTMASMGVDPRSGRYAGVERSADTMTALAAAGAENNARGAVRKEAIALKGDAVNMGNGLPSSAAGSLGLGINAGSTAAATTAGGNAGYTRSIGVMQGGYQTAMQGYGNQANILNQQFQNQLSAWQAQQQAGSGLFSALGGVAGAAIIASSEEYKTDKRPARGVLDAVRDMPVEEWTYKPGIADGGRHIGPYAEDFQAATGKGDGKTIPVVDAIGMSLGAIQELAEEVDRIKTLKAEPRPKRRTARTSAPEARRRSPVSRGVMAAASSS